MERVFIATKAALHLTHFGELVYSVVIEIKFNDQESLGEVDVAFG
jgi:hypothetical protein